MTDAAPNPWARLHLALDLLARDMHLGGMVLRARSGPVLDAALALVRDRLGPLRKLHPSMPTEALDGGLDVQATLRAGHVVNAPGALVPGTNILLPMADRCPPLMASRLAAHIDRMDGILIAVDEGIEDERLPHSLSERCAFEICLDGLSMADLTSADMPDTDATAEEDPVSTLVSLATAFGITSARAPWLALQTLRGLEPEGPTIGGLRRSVELVYAHRATRLPEAAADQPDTPSDPPEKAGDDGQSDQPQDRLPDDLLIEAIKAALPPDLLARLSAKSSRNGGGSGSGHRKQGNRRGRPLPPRGAGGSGSRVDLIASLRAAAPWQTLRKTQNKGKSGPIILTSDLRHKRYEDLSDRLLIFTVDASGSSAVARLAEAKGAVEILLAQAYARRDHVALIAFRGREAEVLLPPTRSLVQTKRRLGALPGGGATPLAHGLVAAHGLALTSRRQGLTPTLVLLTDGRSNIALDGTANRKQAAADVQRSARALCADRIDALVIDTGRRPEDALRGLARTLAAPYIPLPRVDSAGLSRVVNAALDA